MRIEFPAFSGIRCLMMPYIQGNSASVPKEYEPYKDIINTVFLKKGDLGFLTIDESVALKGKPHRGQRAKYGRALHTEAGKRPNNTFKWGGWGSSDHEDTSFDGDIGHAASDYPYANAVLMKAGEVREIGILTPHESLPVQQDCNRQFLRIISSGVWGREEYFTVNPVMQ
jgi:hypothetical protein